MKIIITEQTYDSDICSWSGGDVVSKRHMKDFADINKALGLINQYNKDHKDKLRYIWSLEAE